MTESDPATALKALFSELDIPAVPQQTRSRKTREAILREAEHLFAERGYAATSVNDIASAAGVSVGSLYRYFEDKYQLFLALLANKIELLFTQGLLEFDLNTPPRQSIRDLLHLNSCFNEAFAGVMRACFELRAGDPKLQTFNKKVDLLLFEQVRSILETAARRGLTWPDLDLEATSWIIIRILDPMPKQAAFEEYYRPLNKQDAYIDAVADFIYHAVFKPGSA